METHQGYTSSPDGAQCSDCGDWIAQGEDAVLFQPAKIEENGSARSTALTLHGIVHVECFRDL